MKRVFLIAVAALAVGAAPACAFDDLMIGDSLGVMTAPFIPGVEIHAKAGQRLRWGVQFLRHADRIVWNLGTNDGVFDGLSVRRMRRYVTRVLRYAPCVVVPTMFVQGFGPYTHDYTAVNRYLRHDHRIQVADWAQYMWTHPEHRGDGEHPDWTGIAARGMLIDAALARCPFSRTHPDLNQMAVPEGAN